MRTNVSAVALVAATIALARPARADPELTFESLAGLIVECGLNEANAPTPGWASSEEDLETAFLACGAAQSISEPPGDEVLFDWIADCVTAELATSLDEPTLAAFAANCGGGGGSGGPDGGTDGGTGGGTDGGTGGGDELTFESLAANIVECGLVEANAPAPAWASDAEELESAFLACAAAQSLSEPPDDEDLFEFIADCVTSEMSASLDVATITTFAENCDHHGSSGSVDFYSINTSGLSSCSTGTEFYDTLPFSLSDVWKVTPLGNVTAPGHTFPTGHMYVNVVNNINDADEYNDSDPDDGIPVVAPGHVWVRRVKVSQREVSANVFIPEYSVYFLPCSDVVSWFGHLMEIDEDILAQVIPDNKVCEYDANNCYYNVDVERWGGDPIGIGAGEGHIGNFDFGMRDHRDAPDVFGGPATHATDLDGDIYHARCFINYFTSTPRAQLMSLPGARCGTADHDEPHTAKGIWWNTTSGVEATQMNSLALVDFNEDPDFGEFSIQYAPKSIDLRHTFTELPDGTTNRDFADIAPGPTVYCYETFTNQGNSLVSPTVILLRLVDNFTLQLEVRSDAVTCSSVPRRMTAGAYVEFSRVPNWDAGRRMPQNVSQLASTIDWCWGSSAASGPFEDMDDPVALTSSLMACVDTPAGGFLEGTYESLGEYLAECAPLMSGQSPVSAGEIASALEYCVENGPDEYLADLPHCPGPAAWGTLPIDSSDIDHIAPLATASPWNGNVFGNDHLGITLRVASGHPVETQLVAPGNLKITSVMRQEYVYGGTTTIHAYTFAVVSCREARTIIGPVTALLPGTAVKTAVDALTWSNCSSPVTIPGGTVQTCGNGLDLNLTEGTPIGNVGGSPSGHDFPHVTWTMTDVSVPDASFVSPSKLPWTSPDGHDQRHLVCPFDAFGFSGLERSTLEGLTGEYSADGVGCGVFAQDVAGTLRGRWYKVGASTDQESSQIAFVNLYGDVANRVLSIGSALASSGLPAQLYTLAVGSGTSADEFKDVTPASGAVCYEGLTPAIGTAPNGALLVELTSATELSVEWFASTSCSTTPSFSSPVLFER